MILSLLLSFCLYLPTWAQEEPAPPTPETTTPQETLDLENLLQDGRKRLSDFYESNMQWLKEKKQTQERYLKIANGVLNIVSDKKIQDSTQQLIEKFKFKPLLLTEVLFLLLTLVFRASRPPGRNIFAKILEQLLISIVYLIGAVVVIPTLFLGTNFLYLAWTLSYRLFVLFQSSIGPVS